MWPFLRSHAQNRPRMYTDFSATMFVGDFCDHFCALTLYAPQRRPFRPHFTYLYRLVLMRSRCPQLPKAKHFLAHLALLVGLEALSRPATAQNSLGRGRSPPCAPSCTAARRPAGLRPAEKLRLRRKIEGNHNPRRTALKNQRNVLCRNSLPLCTP
jgi:hypothetical protein